MDKCKNVFRICGNNFSKWKNSPRAFICLSLIIVFMYDTTAGTRALTAAQNMAVTPWLFPFILSYPVNFCVIYLTLILLFCDAPFFDEQFPYLCMRAGRLIWTAGQILYIFAASFVFTILNYGFSLLFCLPNLAFSENWGRILRMMSMPASTNFTKLYLTGIMFDSAGSANVMDTYTPIQALLISLLLMWLAGVFLGLLMFVVNLKAHQGAGALASSFFVIFNFFAFAFSRGQGFKAPIIYYFSPISWVNLTQLQMGSNARPPLSYALTMMSIIIIVLIGLSLKIMKRREIEVLPEI
ncbi:MAG TPA: hypothetical protein DEP60_04795 [Ruminococcaceae bacterium]|nr:hypothetical protein [Oscillospiraceae bacterium]HCC01999.1 hypothetical protein [Oscillospiraceae bacterium]